MEETKKPLMERTKSELEAVLIKRFNYASHLDSFPKEKKKFLENKGTNIIFQWDKDCTLIDGNMQDPMFEDAGINDPNSVWRRASVLQKKYTDECGYVDREGAYIQTFNEMLLEGKLKSLDVKYLQESVGPRVKFFPGVEDFFKNIEEDIMSYDPAFKKFNIHLIHTGVSNGILQIMRGTKIAEYFGSKKDKFEGLYGNFMGNNENGTWFVLGGMTKGRKPEAFYHTMKFPYGEDARVPYSDRFAVAMNTTYADDGMSGIPNLTVVMKNCGLPVVLFNPNIMDSIETGVNLSRMDKAFITLPTNYEKGHGTYDFFRWAGILMGESIVARQLLKEIEKRDYSAIIRI